jgi:uncharacterized membrane protein AbrB (regulator of aidB expression)
LPALPYFFQLTLTLLVAAASALLCEWLHTPIPWMLGPLLATACLSVSGVPTKSSGYLRNVGQWVIGAALGLYFTAEVGRLVLSLCSALFGHWPWALFLAFGCNGAMPLSCQSSPPKTCAPLRILQAQLAALPK